MNVLYVGPYRQQDGWGRASLDYLKALSMTGYNVVARPIWLSNHLTNTSTPLIEELEGRTFSKRPDVIIQNVLPYFGEYQYGMKNILQMYLESSPLTHTNWPTYMNLFDEIWVPTPTECDMVSENGFSKSIRQVPMPFDLDAMEKEVEPLELPIDDDDFIFYFIGEYIERKNIAAALIAFHREFRNTENVRFLIKTNMGSMNANDLFQAVEDNIKQLYQTMRIHANGFGYIREIIITESLTYDQILGLHKRCNCLVMPSRGESTCRPVIEALAVGNDVVLTENTGMADGVRGLVFEAESTKVPASSINPPFPYLYTANETWQEVNIISLQKNMRRAYELHQEGKSKQFNHLKSKVLRQYYSYEAVAAKIKEVLEND